jgi:isopenicillin N synthase-like dioxygenase
MMGRLTNYTFLSTVPRVCNKDTRGRYSLPFFYDLDSDELTTTLPQFVTKDNPLREEYEKGITGYEHYNFRLQRAHYKHPSAVNKVSPALPTGMTRIDGVLMEGM